MSVIKLNVGGTIFHTTRDTLTKFNGFFKAMFENGLDIVSDDSGCIFIDRDPKHFRQILNFMRSGHITLPECFRDIEEIQSEADYYSLDEIIQLCQVKLDEKKMINRYKYLNHRDDLMQIILRAKKPFLLFTYENTPLVPFTNVPGGNEKFDKLIEEYETKLDVYFCSNSQREKFAIYKDGKWETVSDRDGDKALDDLKKYLTIKFV